MLLFFSLNRTDSLKSCFKIFSFQNIKRNNVPSSKFQAKIDEAVKTFEEQLAPDGSENEVDRQARDMAKSMLLNIVCLYKHGDV